MGPFDEYERNRLSAHTKMIERMASLGRVAAGVGHEINNPLAAVIANLDLALSDVEKLAGACAVK